MSEESTNGIGDPVVSETYRESATERAPASLNEAVLRNAAVHAKKGYSHSMLWIRPLAWAATVALSLAIVIDVVLPPGAEPERPAASQAPFEASDVRANLPRADEDVDTDSMSADALEQAAATGEDDDPLKRLRDQEVREETKIEEFDAALGFADSTISLPEAEERQRLAEAAPQPVDAEAADSEAADQAHAYAMAPPERESLETFAQARPEIVDEAASRAALRSGPPQVSALSTAVESSVCEPHELETAEKWAECVDRLVDAGRDAEAETERQRLLEAFPDFEWPTE